MPGETLMSPALMYSATLRNSLALTAILPTEKLILLSIGSFKAAVMA